MNQAKAWSYSEIRLTIAVQCAPVLKGIKASNMITLKYPGAAIGKQIFLSANIPYLVLYEDQQHCVLFVYREQYLASYLNKKECRQFLEGYGYRGLTGREALNHLKKRFQAYYQHQASFPHELGIFLEYPVGDVKGFIANQGKNCLFTGYWKVYENPDNARNRFDAYDQARQEAAKLLHEVEHPAYAAASR